MRKSSRPVGPADAAAGDLPAAQVDALHPRRVDEDLEHRPRQRAGRGSAPGSSLNDSVRLRLAVRRRPGSSSSAASPDHDAGADAQDPVLVEAGDGVERRPRSRGRACSATRSRSAGAVGIEPRLEELDEQPRASPGLFGERRHRCSPGERRADLPQVLGVAPAATATSRPRSPARSTSRLKPVVLQRRRARPSAKASWKRSRIPLGLEVGALLVAQPEVVDPDRVGAGRAHLVRALVDDLDAHVLQQRQHVGERDGLAVAEQLEPQRARRGLQRPVQAACARSSPVAERLHPPDVDDGRGRGRVLLVGGGERIGVAVVQVDAPLLAELVDERVVRGRRPTSASPRRAGPRSRRRRTPGPRRARSGR